MGDHDHTIGHAPIVPFLFTGHVVFLGVYGRETARYQHFYDFLFTVESGAVSFVSDPTPALGDHLLSAVQDVLLQPPLAADHDVIVRFMP